MKMDANLHHHLLLLLLLLTLSLFSQGHAHYHLGKEKVTHLHFYYHETIRGDNTSAVVVAHPKGTIINATNPGPFGTVYVVDDLLTEGPEPDSKLVGQAQGLYVDASRQRTLIVFAVDFGFTSGEFNGSSLSVLSRNPVTESERELAVVGGRGKFRMARGFANLKTYSLNATAGVVIVEYKVTVFHYE